MVISYQAQRCYKSHQKETDHQHWEELHSGHLHINGESFELLLNSWFHQSWVHHWVSWLSSWICLIVGYGYATLSTALFFSQLLETCVKNCGKRFHIQVAQKDFLQDLIKIIGPKNDPPQVVQEKVLSLIQVMTTPSKCTYFNDQLVVL